MLLKDFFNYEIRALPAYGRNYETLADAVADWEAGKDFWQLQFPGLYFSNRDSAKLKQDGVKRVTFYNLNGRLGSVYL